MMSAAERDASPIEDHRRRADPLTVPRCPACGARVEVLLSVAIGAFPPAPRCLGCVASARLAGIEVRGAPRRDRAALPARSGGPVVAVLLSPEILLGPVSAHPSGPSA